MPTPTLADIKAELDEIKLQIDTIERLVKAVYSKSVSQKQEPVRAINPTAIRKP